MRNLKTIILTSFLTIVHCYVALSDITASVPTNLIQKIASASSYTSTSQNTDAIVKQVENITSSVVNVKELRKTVENDAKAFGLAINEEALARMSGQTLAKKKVEGTVTISAGGSDVYEAIEYPEPNLDTIVYDTGMMTLTKEGGNYNDDSSNTIFDATAGAQQARIKVFIDFKRKKQWGSIESRMTFDTLGGDQITNIKEGGATTITKLPFESELLSHVSSSTGKLLSNADAPTRYEIQPDNVGHLRTSVLRVDGSNNGDAVTFDSGSDRKNFQNSMAHGTNGSKNVFVGANFSTGSVGTPGTSTASFEASHAAKDANAAAFKTSVVRYSATATTTASKYTGD
jgi:hypothetical protein